MYQTKQRVDKGHVCLHRVQRDEALVRDLKERRGRAGLARPADTGRAPSRRGGRRWRGGRGGLSKIDLVLSPLVMQLRICTYPLGVWIRTAKLENIVRTIAGQRQNDNKNTKNSLCCRWHFANQAKRGVGRHR